MVPGGARGYLRGMPVKFTTWNRKGKVTNRVIVDGDGVNAIKQAGEEMRRQIKAREVAQRSAYRRKGKSDA
jgi:hypothetical protein